MSRSTIVLVCAASALLAGFAVAGPSILVDEIHGEPRHAEFAAVWPDCQVVALTSDAFPIETMLASGVIAVAETTFTVSVPAGAPALYGRFRCPDGTFQYPYLKIRDAGGTVVARQFWGALHLEDPPAGVYEIEYSSWDPMEVPFEVGTGPHALTAETVADHDVVFRAHSNMYMLFCGEIPEYSAREEAVLLGRVADGGGNLLLREPLLEIALKPIIDLTSGVPLTCDVVVELPGSPTYLDPPCDTDRVPGGTVLTWHDVDVAPGAITRLAYEGALQPAHHQLQVDTGGGAMQLRNHARETLHEIVLARRAAGGDWDLVRVGDLAPGATAAAPAARRLTHDAAAAVLRSTIAAGGRRNGLSEAQLAEFQGRYLWADRALDGAEHDGGWVALYRVGTAACDRLLPLETVPTAETRQRVLWFWVGGIPEAGVWSGAWPTAPDPGPRASLAPAAAPLVVQEYGVIRQRYPSAPGKAQRQLAWFGWSFYDDAGLEDPTDNLGDPTMPLLYTAGGHPDAAELLEGAYWLEGDGTGVVTAPASERLLVGDEDSHTSDMVYPPGSFPAVVVGRDWGAGRAAAIHDQAFESYWNRPYLRRVLDWVAGDLTGVPDDHRPPAAVTSLAARPNPFNPRTEIVFSVNDSGPVTVAVYDAAGRRLVELLRGEVAAGARRLFWDGTDDAGRPVAAGVYLVRATASGGVRSIKVTLVQ